MAITCDKERIIEIEENNEVKYLINVDKVDGFNANEISFTIQKDGAEVGKAPIINFIAGDNVVITITDDSSNGRINIMITAT